MRAALLALLLLAPGALALDAFPGEGHVGATQADFLVRLPRGGTLHLDADAPVDVTVDGKTRALPADFAVTEDQTWHGLSGVVAIHATRVDPGREVHLTARDEAGGYEFAWPAAAPEESTGILPRWVPGAGPLAMLGIVATLAFIRSHKRGPNVATFKEEEA